jgi:hypothetical protein
MQRELVKLVDSSKLHTGVGRVHPRTTCCTNLYDLAATAGKPDRKSILFCSKAALSGDKATRAKKEP